MAIPNKYVLDAPHPQNALDLFEGNWMCDVPSEEGRLTSGKIPAFEDGRIEWLKSQLDTFRGMHVIELGPYEAGHTYMFEKGGAASVTAIEANTYSFLKCLTVKEVTNLTRSRFLLGDFVEYLRRVDKRFDLAAASGVLYHMKDPAELIYLLSRVTDVLFIWTHYHEQEIIDANPALEGRFGEGVETEFRGFKHTLYQYQYTTELQLEYFAGGNAQYSRWMRREDILACLQTFGFATVNVGMDDPEHPNGPCFCVLGLKPVATKALEARRAGSAADKGSRRRLVRHR